MTANVASTTSMPRLTVCHKGESSTEEGGREKDTQLHVRVIVGK